MNRLPKDVTRIIYGYLYNDVPKLLYRYVVKYENTSEHRNYYLPVLHDASLVKSTKCKICSIYPEEEKKENCIWLRSQNSKLGLLGNTRNKNLCTHLIKCQENSASWNKSFKENHRFSIINGVVYHCSTGEYPNNDRYRLVPYFQSDHCWQDLAVRFMRNMNINENTHELDECVRKQSQGQARPKHNNNCTIC